MLAPFDFTHAINLETSDNDESIELRDVVVPGFFLAGDGKISLLPMGWVTAKVKL